MPLNRIQLERPETLTIKEVLGHLEEIEEELLEYEGMGEWNQDLIDEYKETEALIDCMMRYFAEHGTFYAQPGICQGATAVADIMGVLMYYKPIVGVNKGNL